MSKSDTSSNSFLLQPPNVLSKDDSIEILSVRSQSQQKQSNSQHVCGLQLDKFPPSVQFLLCTSAVFLLFILYGYYQVSVLLCGFSNGNG